MNSAPPSSVGLSNEAFRAAVAQWSTWLHACADLGVASAKEDYDAGKIDLVAYNAALQNELALTDSCIEMVNQVDAVLAATTAASLQPIVDATAQLGQACATANRVMDGVAVVAGAGVAVAAILQVFGSPTPATIGGAASAVGGLVGEVVKTVQQV